MALAQIWTFRRNLVSIAACMIAATTGCTPPEARGVPEPHSTSSTATTPAAGKLVSQREQHEADSEPAVGEAPNDVAIKLRPVNLAEYQQVIKDHHGKIVVVDFWATWCAECLEVLSHTLALGEELRDQGVDVVTVSLDVQSDHMAAITKLQSKFRASEAVHLRTVHEDFDETMESVFELVDETLPHLKVYDRDGKLVATFSGEEIDDERVRAVVNTLIEKPME